MPPSGPSSLKMVITDRKGINRDLTVSHKGHITWFRKDKKSGELAIEGRQADDEHTTMSLEINDKANTINLTKTKYTENNTIQTTTENIFTN